MIPAALGSGVQTLEANDALSWKVPTPGLLSFDVRLVNASGWGANVFDNTPFVDVLLINKTNYDIYTASVGAITVDHRYFFKRVNWVWRRDMFLGAAFDFVGDWYLVVDNGFVWDLDAAGVDPGPSARPPRGRASNLTVRYSVEYVVSSAVTQLTAPCGTVTLNKTPNPAFYYRLTTGVWEIEFGIDSCATGVVPTGNVTAGPCPLIYYILDRANFDIVAANDFQAALHEASIQPPPTGARHTLNVTSAVGELFFVLYAKSATTTAWYRVDKLGEVCGKAPPANSTCALGTLDCACHADASCNRGLRCNAATVTCVACPVGDANCACRQSFTCSAADLYCTGASLRTNGVCTRCAAGAAGCSPRLAGVNDTVWDRCDADLKPFAMGSVEVCLACPRGDTRCRCGPANQCSVGNLCNATTETCTADPTRTTVLSTVPPTTAPVKETTRFVVEPVETRGNDPSGNAATPLRLAAFAALVHVYFTV